MHAGEASNDDETYSSCTAKGLRSNMQKMDMKTTSK